MVMAVSARASIERRKPLAAVSRPRRRGLVLQAPQGAYAQVPICAADDFVELVAIALERPGVEALRREMRVAGPQTVLAACREWARYAHHRTGRDVAVSHETVAEAIGYKRETVKKICRFITRLGFMVEVARGRNKLSRSELAEARRLGAVDQQCVASTRALTVPALVDGAPLPSVRTVNNASPVKKRSPRRAHSRPPKADASRRPALTKGDCSPGRENPRALSVQRLAAQLVERMPWLDRRGRHVGHVCDAIERHTLTQRGWTPQQILDRIDAYARANGIRSKEPSEQRDPLAYLFWMIRQAIPETEVAPFARVAQERDERRAAAAARRAEDVARQAAIDAQQSEIEAVIQAMHQRFPRVPKRAQRFV